MKVIAEPTDCMLGVRVRDSEYNSGVCIEKYDDRGDVKALIPIFEDEIDDLLITLLRYRNER